MSISCTAGRANRELRDERLIMGRPRLSDEEVLKSREKRRKYQNEHAAAKRAALRAEFPLGILYKGEHHSLSAWAKIVGVKVATLNSRIRRGMTPQEALDRGKANPYHGTMPYHSATKETLA